MQNRPYVLVTADTHAGGNHARHREHLDPKYRDAFDAWAKFLRENARKVIGRD